MSSAIRLVAFVVLVACSTGTSSATPDAASPATACQFLAPFGPGGGQCTVNLSGCTDGHTYRVNCAGAPVLCTCEVDGTSVKSASLAICGLTGPSLVSTIDQGCGWSLASK